MGILKELICHPQSLLGIIVRHTPIGKWMSDEQFVKCDFYSKMGKWPDLKNPITFSEKIQWMKLHDKHSEYTQLVDKAEVKAYVENATLGAVKIIPTLGVWDSFEEINFETLPDQFVLKCTHDSQSTIIVKDKKTFEKEAARKKLNKCLKRNFFWITREYPYKDAKPRIIAEQYMEDESGKGLKDYKFFCFNGEPKMMFVATGRPINTCFDFFDMDFNHLDIRQGHPNATQTIIKPEGWENMKKYAAQLSKGFPHVRVDFYDINGDIYFGELTFFHFSGNIPFDPEEWDYKIGEWLSLPKA